MADRLFSAKYGPPERLPHLAKLLLRTSELIVERARRGEYTGQNDRSGLVLSVRRAIALLCGATCVRPTLTWEALLEAAQKVGDSCAQKVVDDYCAMMFAPLMPWPVIHGKFGVERADLLVALSQEVIDGKLAQKSLMEFYE
jgi:hypothetical protein